MSKLLPIFTIWSLFFSQVSLAVDFTLEKDFALRQASAGGLTILENLPKGTVVRIPDHFFGKDLKGKMKDEIALINWLKKAGVLKKFVTKSGVVKRDYFFPIEVVSSPDKSISSGKSGEIAIRHLAMKNGLQLVTVTDTPLVKASNVKNPPKKTDNCSQCKTQTQGQQLYSDIKGQLQSIFQKIKEGAQDKVNSKNYSDIFIKNFNKTCGMDFHLFLGELKKEAHAQGIPPEILLGIMSQESEGKCDAEHKDANGTYSVGIFQINTGSTKLKYADLKDPRTNMNESIRILVNKYKRVNGAKPTPKETLLVSDMNKHELTKWKKALSAYNGGEAHLKQSEQDLGAINEKYGLSLDSEDWETRRAFYFRKYIEENTDAKFNNKQSYKRSTNNSIANLIYVESILGMDEISGSLAASWIPELTPEIKKEITIEEDQKRREDQIKKRVKEEQEEERKQKQLADEKHKAEEKRKRLEAQRHNLKEEKKRLDNEQKLREEELKRIKSEEERDKEREKIRLQEEQKRREEKIRKAESEKQRLEVEKKNKNDADAINRAEKAISDFNLRIEEDRIKREAEYTKRREEYEKKQVQDFAKWRQKENELERIRLKQEKIIELNQQNTEVDRLNNSKADHLDNTLRKFSRTTIFGIARLKYDLKFRNTNKKYAQKCTVKIQSFYNQVNDEDEHTFILKPGQSKEIDGTLKKPWVAQGGRVIEACEFLPNTHNK